MSVSIVAPASSGKTLFATLQQITGGTLGDQWNATVGAWQAAGVAIADRKITLTESASPDLQRYTGGIATALGTYTGRAIAAVHDDNNGDVVIGSAIIYFQSGIETDIGSVVTPTVSAVIVSRDRTWFVKRGEFSTAPEIIEISVGTTATLAFDFRTLLNPNTDINATPTVVVDTVQSGVAPAISNAALNQDRTRAHFDVSSTVQGEYKIKVTATTTDGQTFVRYGWLYVR